jgi:hypothetical protein
VAFEFGDQEYSRPNKTLMSYVEGSLKRGKEAGHTKEVKGYWGDIHCSPFFALGINCDTPNAHAVELFDILNKDTGTEQHRHTANEVAVYNMLSFLWEIENSTVYRMTRAHDIFSGLGQVDTPPPPPKPTLAEQLIAASKDDDDGDEAAAAEEEKVEKQEGNDKEKDQEKSGGGAEKDTKPEATKDSNTEGNKEKPKEEEEEEEEEETPKPKPVEQKPQPQQRAPLSEQEKMVILIRRAQTIVETLKDVRIFPVSGKPDTVLSKERFKDFFHGAYFSTRALHWAGMPVVANTLRSEGLVALETGKFVTPLRKANRTGLLKALRDAGDLHSWKEVKAPVSIRRRDEKDLHDDVLFFAKPGPAGWVDTSKGLALVSEPASPPPPPPPASDSDSEK